MIIIKVTIHRGPVAVPVDKKGVDAPIHVKDRDGGFLSVGDAIRHRIEAWEPSVQEGTNTLAAKHTAAMRIIDRTFSVRCPFSLSQIDRLVGISDANTYVWI